MSVCRDFLHVKVHCSTNLYVHTNVPAPYRRHLFELMSKSFRQVKVFFYEKPDWDRPWTAQIEDWQIDAIWLRRQRRFRWMLSWRLVKEVFRQKCGSVHLVAMNGYVTDLMFIWLTALCGWSRLILWNDGGRISNHSALTRVVYRCMARWGVIGVFTPGKIGSEYARDLGFRRKQIINSFFSHDVDLFSQYYEKFGAADRQLVRERHRTPMRQIVILSVSRFLPLKRLSDAAEALKKIEDVYPLLAGKLEYWLIGDGDDRSHEKILGGMNIIKVVRLHQMPQDKLMSYYCGADIFLFPSEGDIWGLVVNEALSMSRPVVCTDVVGASELIHNGENGYVVLPRSVDEMVAALVHFVRDPSLLAHCQATAKQIFQIWNSRKGVASLVDFIERGA